MVLKNGKGKPPLVKKAVIAQVFGIRDYAKQNLDSYALPEVCNRVRSLLDKENTTMAEVAKAVVFDPSVASEVMKLANSPIFNFKREIDTLVNAVTVLGGERIYSMLVSQFTMTTFHELHSKNLDMKRFWVNSFCTAFIAHDLAKVDKMTAREQETLYICGLMHNIGELAVAKLSPKSAVLCEKLVFKGIHPWVAQKEQLGFNYVQCSAIMMRNWDLPETMVKSLQLMTSSTSNEINKFSRILNISANCALSMTTEKYFDLDEYLDNNHWNLTKAEIDSIHSSKRRAIDHSGSVIDLMDSFKLEKYMKD